MTQNEVFKEIISSRRTKQTKGILLNDDNGKRVSNDRQKIDKQVQKREESSIKKRKKNNICREKHWA